MGYDKWYGQMRIRLGKGDVQGNRAMLGKYLEAAYKRAMA